MTGSSVHKAEFASSEKRMFRNAQNNQTARLLAQVQLIALLAPIFFST